MARAGGFFFEEHAPGEEGAVAVGAAYGDEVSEADTEVGEGEGGVEGQEEAEEEVEARTRERDEDVFEGRSGLADCVETFPAQADVLDLDAEHECGGDVSKLVDGHGEHAEGYSRDERREPMDELEHAYP